MSVRYGTRTAKGKTTAVKKKPEYRSGLEKRTAVWLKRNKVSFEYETEHIEYTSFLRRKYKPDFIIKTKSGKKIYIETKGFWDAHDRKKHLLIRQQHPDLDIRFVFSNSKTKILKGSQTSYADICNGLGRGEYKGHVWLFADDRIPKEWINE